MIVHYRSGVISTVLFNYCSICSVLFIAVQDSSVRSIMSKSVLFNTIQNCRVCKEQPLYSSILISTVLLYDMSNAVCTICRKCTLCTKCTIWLAGWLGDGVSIRQEEGRRVPRGACRDGRSTLRGWGGRERWVGGGVGRGGTATPYRDSSLRHPIATPHGDTLPRQPTATPYHINRLINNNYSNN